MRGKLAVGAFFSYTPQPSSDESRLSKSYMYALKTDALVGSPPRSMSVEVASRVRAQLGSLQFASFFGLDVSLIPVPRSAALPKDAWARSAQWVPLGIADALVDAELASETLPCLRRETSVPKASFQPADKRPKPLDHYESLRVERGLSAPKRILLIDDIATRGSALLGAAWRLEEAFPDVEINAFVAMRTVHDSSEFRSIEDPRIGMVHFMERSGKSKVLWD